MSLIDAKRLDAYAVSLFLKKPVRSQIPSGNRYAAA
jgi:hypothetical protein